MVEDRTEQLGARGIDLRRSVRREQALAVLLADGASDSLVGSVRRGAERPA